MRDEIIVYVTCVAEDSTKLANHLVNEGLAACVNIIPQVTSIYNWQGQTITDAEQLLLIKSSRKNFIELANRIKELHSYEIPEIICVAIEYGYKPYLEWLN